MAPRNVLFDLDGTLTDSSEGVARSLHGALGELGLELPTYEELAWCIGPDIRWSLARLLETEDRACVERVLGVYRCRYDDTDVVENRLYEGVPAMLRALRAAGCRLYVVTSSPRPFARRVVEHLGLAGSFEAVHGPDPDALGCGKPELLAGLVAAHDLELGATVMIGDRGHDVRGARAVGIGALAVTYGYGTEEELRRAAPDLFCRAPLQIPSALGLLG